MAVDRKADYPGNHGGSYTDEDGMSKQFTYIDHDKKSKISINRNTPFNEEWNALERCVLNHPLFYAYLETNQLEWGVNVTLGDLRKICSLIEKTKKK